MIMTKNKVPLQNSAQYSMLPKQHYPIQGTFQLHGGTTVTYREATPKDAFLVFSLMKILLAQTNNFARQEEEVSFSLTTEVTKLQNYQKFQNSICLLAFLNQQLIAIASLDGKMFKRIQHRATLFIGIQQQYWKHGLGSKLLSLLLQWAQQNPILQKIELHVRAKNTPAITLYQKFGFAQVGILKSALYIDDQFEDELIMELWLSQKKEGA